MADFNPTPEHPLGPEFQFTSLTKLQRAEIVNRTAVYSDPTTAPARANLLMLTALGASLDLEGSWEPSGQSALQQWRHITTQGRDHYVRIAERGYLFPVGHPAVRVDVVERVFAADPDGRVAAYLEKKSFIRVTKPLKTYPAEGQPFGARAWPFTSLRVTDELSPLIEKDLEPLMPGDGQAGFPLLAGTDQDVRWTLVATDAVGNRLAFSVPLVFVYGRGAGHPGSPHDESYTKTLADRYNSSDVEPARRTAGLGGARLQYLRDESQPGTTTHPTASITLAAATKVFERNPNNTAPDTTSAETLAALDQPAFYPSLAAARPGLPAADALSENKEARDLDVRPYHRYVENGLSDEEGNKGKVYAQANEPTPLRFAGDAVGAVATPNFAVTGLSAMVGPIGGNVETYAANAQVEPADYFGGVAEEVLGKLLGGLELRKIIGTMPAPTIVETVETATPAAGEQGGGLDIGRRTIRYHLEAPLKEIKGTFVPAAGARLVMDTVAVFPPEGQPTYDVTGHIDAFTVQILGGGALHFIDIPFNGVDFTASKGAKPDIDLDIGKVDFAGRLRFVNQLAAFLNGLQGVGPGAAPASASAGQTATAAAAADGGGGSGLTVTVLPSAIDAGMTLALPAITVGVFNMQNLALNAGVHVPFTGAPTVARFSFSSREHPFMLTVMAFGGGGLIGLNVGLNQVELVEASLEFGAQIALNLGVASGGVTVAGGVYFKFENDKGLDLTGFVRVTGALEVLGLIAISAEFNLALTYKEKPSEGEPSSLAGTATLRVEIDLAFFSVSKNLTVSQEFAGADPSFQQMVPDLATWQAYCDAFAA